jgi:flagellar export protein FliJ
MLMRMRMHDENIARRSCAESLACLQVIEGRVAMLNETLGQYDAAAGETLLSGVSARVLGQYALRTGDIRKELSRLEEQRSMLNQTLQQSEAMLLEAHRARKSADQYHLRLVRMIALKRTAEIDKQTGHAHQAYSSRSNDSWENHDVC